MSQSKCLLFVIVVLTLLMTGTALAGSKVEVKSTDFNFGRVIQHAQVSHLFWIKSVGEDTLRVTKIIPGCGCTKVPLSDSTIAPGDSVPLEILFSTRSFRGNVSKRPAFKTNAGPEKTYLRIDAEMVVDPATVMPVTVEPFRLDVSQFTKKPRRRARFQIINKTDIEYPIKLIDHAYHYFDVQLPDKIGPAETVEGVITVHKERIDQEFERSLTFEIQPPDELPIRYTVAVKRMVRIKDSDN